MDLNDENNRDRIIWALLDRGCGLYVALNGQNTSTLSCTPETSLRRVLACVSKAQYLLTEYGNFTPPPVTGARKQCRKAKSGGSAGKVAHSSKDRLDLVPTGELLRHLYDQPYPWVLAWHEFDATPGSQCQVYGEGSKYLALGLLEYGCRFFAEQKAETKVWSQPFMRRIDAIQNEIRAKDPANLSENSGSCKELGLLIDLLEITDVAHEGACATAAL